MKQKDKEHNFLNNYQLFLKNSGYDKSILNKKSESKIYSYKQSGSFGSSERYFDNFLKKHKEHFNNNLFLQKASELKSKHELPPVLKTSKNLFMTFAKDVLLGTALFITATVGIVAVSVAPRIALHEPQPYITPVNANHISSTYMDFIRKTSIYDDTTKEIAQLKDQGLINEVDKSRNFTPLTYAIHYKNKAAIEKLIENGAVINLPSANESRELVQQLSYYNTDYQVNFKNHIEITDLLLSKGLDWRQNDYQLLKNTATHKDWREFWIKYFATNNKAGLDIYKNILRENISMKDVLIYDSLKELNNKNIKNPKAEEGIEVIDAQPSNVINTKDYKALRELT